MGTAGAAGAATIGAIGPLVGGAGGLTTTAFVTGGLVGGMTGAGSGGTMGATATAGFGALVGGAGGKTTTALVVVGIAGGTTGAGIAGAAGAAATGAFGATAFVAGNGGGTGAALVTGAAAGAGGAGVCAVTGPAVTASQTPSATTLHGGRIVTMFDLSIQVLEARQIENPVAESSRNAITADNTIGVPRAARSFLSVRRTMGQSPLLALFLPAALGFRKPVSQHRAHERKDPRDHGRRQGDARRTGRYRCGEREGEPRRRGAENAPADVG